MCRFPKQRDRAWGSYYLSRAMSIGRETPPLANRFCSDYFSSKGKT